MHQTSQMVMTRAKPKNEPKKLNRAQKAEANRAALIQAAAEVVGEQGYSNASVSMITQRAGLGQGTFYRYFENQQALFDMLLPFKGTEALDYFDKAVQGAGSFVDGEIRAMKATFFWARENPWFLRLLHEAPVAAPEGYRIHLENVSARFRKSLLRGWMNGEFPGFQKSELDTIMSALMAARDYLTSDFFSRNDQTEGALREVLEAYRKFISFGLKGKP